MSEEPSPAAKKDTRTKRAVEGETRRERFERLANYRTNQVLEKIRILGGIANSRYYDYSEKDVNVIFDSIFEELEATKRKFLSAAEKEDKFRLEDRLKDAGTAAKE